MNIRPATQDDLPFLRKMLYEAARWNPDWPREPIEEVLAEPDAPALPPGLGPARRRRRGRRDRRASRSAPPGTGCSPTTSPATASSTRRPRSCRSPSSRCTGARASARRSCARAWSRRARKGSRRLSLSVAVHNRSRMMYQRAGFEKVAESGRRVTGRWWPTSRSDAARPSPGRFPRSLRSLSPDGRRTRRVSAASAASLRRYDPPDRADRPGRCAARIETGTKYCSRVCHWAPRALPARARPRHQGRTPKSVKRREAPEVHPGDAGGQADEGPDQGDEAAEEYDGLAPAFEPRVGPVHLVGAQ